LGCLSAGLLVVVLWQGRQLHSFRAPEGQAPPQTPETAASSSSDPGGPAEALTGILHLPPAKKPAVADYPPGRASFDWKNVESADYAEYVKNLRAIGCPEQTIHDIVAADVLQSYAPKRAAAAAEAYGDFKYWAGGDDSLRRAAMLRERRAVDEEMNGAVTALLGNDVLPPDTEREWRAAILDQQLAYLSPDKRELARNTLLRNADTDTQVTALTSNHLPTQDIPELKQIMSVYDAEQASLAHALTPEELAQLQMSVTSTAANVRRRLAEFNPTEAEFQTIFEDWRAQDLTLARGHTEGIPDTGNLQYRVHDQVRQQLGEARYQQYLRSWNK
jgi:hypothetical protein